MTIASPALSLALAVAVNCASVAAEGRCRALSSMFGRSAWLAHAGLVVPPWARFLWSLRRVPGRHVPRAVVGAGLLGEAAGMALVAMGFHRLGPAAAVNGDVFGLVPRTSGPAPVLGRVRDPIYTGYSVWLAGWALRTGRLLLLPVAAQMMVLLTLEARIEDWAGTRSGEPPAQPRRPRPASPPAPPGHREPPPSPCR